MMSPGRGDLPEGQFDAQKRLPNGSGMPSFASSWFTRAAAKVWTVQAQKNANGIKEETYDGDDVTERAAGSLLASDSSNFEMWVIQDESHLSATNTVSAFCACAPNTFLKNKLATVTPELWISSFVAALSDPIHSKCGQPE